MAKSIKQLDDHNLLKAAFTAVQTNQAELAIKHFKEAIRRDPSDPFAHMEIAKCHYRLDRPADAKAWLEKIVALTRQDTDLLLPLAAAFQFIRDYPAAIHVMEEAEQTPRLRGVALVRQAELHELSNSLPKAEASLAKLEALNEPVTQAQRAISAKIHRRQGNLEQARTELEPLIAEVKESDGAGKDFAASLEYELAHVLDKLGDYDTAFSHLISAKSHHLGTDAYNIAHRGRGGVTGTLAGLCKDISQETFSNWAAEQNSCSEGTFSHAFLLGHPRSGTTLIEQALDAHPQLTSADETSMLHNAIWMPTVLQEATGKAASYGEFLDVASPNYIRRLRKDYRVKWKKMAAGRLAENGVLLDKNPALTTRLAVIARFFPDSPIVFAIRDPRDVVLSSFMQPVGVNDWSINWLSLEETVDYYCFAMQMWLDIRDKLPNPWIEVKYEDCVADLATETKKATEHLGLEWHPNQSDIQQHVRKKLVFSPTYGDVGKKVYSTSIQRWRNYEEQLSPHLTKLLPFVQAFGY